jgi:hypothetical protein
LTGTEVPSALRVPHTRRHRTGSGVTRPAARAGCGWLDRGSCSSQLAALNGGKRRGIGFDCGLRDPACQGESFDRLLGPDQRLAREDRAGRRMEPSKAGRDGVGAADVCGRWRRVPHADPPPCSHPVICLAPWPWPRLYLQLRTSARRQIGASASLPVFPRPFIAATSEPSGPSLRSGSRAIRIPLN